MAWYWWLTIASIILVVIIVAVRALIGYVRGTKFGCRLNLHDDLIVKEFHYVNEAIYGLECSGCGRPRCSVLGRVPKSVTQYTEAVKLAKPWLEEKSGRKIYGPVADAF